jgi:hypothetical protein
MSVNQSVTLERRAFEFSRAGEYLDFRELQTMTGQPAERFPEVILKELLDNGLDAAEAARRAPEVTVRLLRRGGLVYLFVRDNGSGIDPGTVAKVLNFATRTSDKSAYRAPTRGAQGNALKTILGIPAALGARAPVYIEAGGVRHRIEAGLDPAGEVRVTREERPVPERPGTLVAVPLPSRSAGRTPFLRWARAFSLFNPHASVRILSHDAARKHANTEGGESRNSYRRTVAFPSGGWRKFLPGDLTSAWWYDAASLGKLVFAHVNDAGRGGPDLLFRDFVRQFRGLSPTKKAKAVCGLFPGVGHLSDFTGRPGDVPLVLDAMRVHSQAPSPGVLGEVGEAHLRERFDRWFGVKRWWYRKVVGEAAGVCYVVEVALAETDRPGGLFHGVNFSPTFDDPLAGTALPAPEFTAYGVAGFLGQAHAPSRTVAAFHLSCPVIETLDKGKTRLKVPGEVAAAAGKALWSVTRQVYREGEQRRKDAARQERADRQREREARSHEWSLKRAVFEVMREAVRKSAGGLGRVSAHTLFYHVRPLIQQYTDRELTSDYFEQTLLPAYQREVEPIPEVYYEPRGTLYEPHTGGAVPLGTREVERYAFPSWLYDKILFVEKKGLWPVFEAARLAERYDMAVVAGEGYATEACRMLFAQAEHGRDYQLFVLHDADPHGYNIARTLREETERMPGHRVGVIDLGLRLEEALSMGLSAEAFTRKKQLPQGLRLGEAERDYFEGRRTGPRSWVCRRVELNALSGPALIAYVEAGLRAAGVRGKVIPPGDVLAQNFWSQVGRLLRENVEREFRGRIDDEVRQRLEGLRGQGEECEGWLGAAVRDAVRRDPSRPWSGAVTDEALALVRARPAQP